MKEQLFYSTTTTIASIELIESRLPISALRHYFIRFALHLNKICLVSEDKPLDGGHLCVWCHAIQLPHSLRRGQAAFYLCKNAEPLLVAAGSSAYDVAMLKRCIATDNGPVAKKKKNKEGEDRALPITVCENSSFCYAWEVYWKYAHIIFSLFLWIQKIGALCFIGSYSRRSCFPI